MSIIELLFESTLPISSSPAYRAQLEKLRPYDEQLGKAFSTRFLSEYAAVEGALIGIELTESFTRGFRIGFSLAQELSES